MNSAEVLQECCVQSDGSKAYVASQALKYRESLSINTAIKILKFWETSQITYSINVVLNIILGNICVL